MSKVSVAILGAGLFARIAHLPAIHKLDNTYELKAIYSRSESSAKALAESAEEQLALSKDALTVYHDAGGHDTSLNSLLSRKDIQAVIVVLPINTQPGIILKALEAGKHVLSEKPVAPTVKEGLKLIQTYESIYKPKGLIWRVAENFEAEPGLQAAGKAIAEGKIGKVCFWNHQVLNNVTTDSMWYKTPWRTTPEYQGGFLLDGGVHSAAALRVVLPSPLKTLTGFASLNRPHLAPHDTIHTLIRNADGSHGIFELSFGLPAAPGSDSFKVVGTEGTLSILRYHENKEAYIKVQITSANTGETEEIVEKGCGVEKELANFAAHLDGTDDGLGSPRGALQDVAIIQAGLESHGSPIDLQRLVTSTD